MRFYIFLLLFCHFSYAQDPILSITNQQDNDLFITNFEYGQMLYENPRGIGCIKCHGKNGKGSLVARYTHKNKDYEINSPAINSISLDKFIKKLKTKSTSRSIMPTYFLTNDEMKQIHFYLTQEITNE